MAASLSYANVNALWATFFVESLALTGLRYAVISPGSRSAPLAWALATNATVEAIPVVDERSAAFFALGLARRSGEPVVLLATSGTAGANYYPAVIEASEAGVPLLVLTADRPVEMRDCRAGQTTDQRKIYGSFARWQTELLLPEASPEIFRYLRQTLAHAWAASRGPLPGPVHLNVPFRDPLAPVEDGSVRAWSDSGEIARLLPGEPAGPPARLRVTADEAEAWIGRWRETERGIIVAGPAQPVDAAAYCRALGALSAALGWPVLSDGLSPVRNFLELVPAQVSRYEFLLRDESLSAALRPETVLQIGALPTGKSLRARLGEFGAETFVLDPGDRNLDPLHGRTVHLRGGVTDFVSAGRFSERPAAAYRRRWLDADAACLDRCSGILQATEDRFEGKIAWLMSRHLPEGTPIFVASSMPVRDVEFFWEPGNLKVRPYCNRGVNGIDGTLSTALGVCHDGAAGVLLTGDLAFLHDTNGLLSLPRFRGGLTVLLVNNRGGGIFEKLPMARFDPPFETFFATPQDVDFGRLLAAYGAAYERIDSWEDLIPRLEKLPDSGLRVLEIPTGRKADTAFRERLFAELAGEIAIR